MQGKLVSNGGGITRSVFTVEIISATGHNLAPDSIITRENADAWARALSELVSHKYPGAQVRLVTMARIKAFYENGERLKVSDYRDFYELTDEEYEETRILCQKTYAYV